MFGEIKCYMEDMWPESKLSVSFSSLVELALVTLLDDQVQGLLESQENSRTVLLKCLVK
jgi:hypothetical protein